MIRAHSKRLGPIAKRGLETAAHPPPPPPMDMGMGMMGRAARKPRAEGDVSPTLHYRNSLLHLVVECCLLAGLIRRQIHPDLHLST